MVKLHHTATKQMPHKMATTPYIVPQLERRHCCPCIGSSYGAAERTCG